MAMQCFGVPGMAIAGHFFSQQKFELSCFFSILKRLYQKKVNCHR